MSEQLDNKIVGVLFASAALLAHSYPSSFAYDRPIHTLVYGLALAGFSLLSLAQSYPNLFRLPAKDGVYAQVAIKDESDDESVDSYDLDERKEAITEPTAIYKPLGSLFLRVLLVLSVCAISARLEIFRHISKATECATSSFEVFLPMAVALYDALRFQKPVITVVEDCPDASMYETIYEDTRSYVRCSRFRYVPSTTLLSVGLYLTTFLWSGLPSTYICPVVGAQNRAIPSLQFAAFLLDFGLLIAFLELALHGSLQTLGNRGRGPVAWAHIIIAASIFWIIVGLIYFFVKPEDRGWLMALSGPFRVQWFKAATWQAILFSALFVSSAYSILRFGALALTMTLATILTSIPALKRTWTAQLPFPPMPTKGTILSFLLIYIAWLFYERINQSVASRRRTGIGRHILYFSVVMIAVFPSFLRTNQMTFHPIDLLIYNARLQHNNYVQYQTQSHGLEDAVAQYRRRYSIPPPPGFDKWYAYARSRSCVILDQYDQMHEDLLPWRSISPSEIRRLTTEIVSNPWNEICGISIRNGNATAMKNAIPTHAWMLEGIIKMIEPFQEFLPDMDIAFNMNDEARVAIPHEELKYLRKQGEEIEASAHRAGLTWSRERNETWSPVPEEPTTRTTFKNLSFRQTFHAFGSVGCDPKSPARKKPINSMATMCLECSAPHSMGQFVANWSYAADICHQPDLAHLHGFYLSPAAFKASNTLQPVFSQSKPHGYNDILYPSAWNYMDKVRYFPLDPMGNLGEPDYFPGNPDIPFSEKKNVLFWRGSTSEGVAEGIGRATWRGMVRQRIVYLANNLTDASYDNVVLLLPKHNTGKYEYELVSGNDVEKLGLLMDIHIVDRIARCGGVDCDDQAEEFGLVQPTDFQDHWQYRYLFDLDGAGFSGRFLPFLQSKSLPFKTALFREWYDERLTAWRHFVPQDLRLHDVYSTLAYFAGFNGTLHGKPAWMTPHLGEAEMIAEEGRRWAEKVLRKEDMEVYFFRLLLEWGRLTDDNRDELGYIYKPGDA